MPVDQYAPFELLSLRPLSGWTTRIGEVFILVLPQAACCFSALPKNVAVRFRPIGLVRNRPASNHTAHVFSITKFVCDAPLLYFPLTYCVGMWACPREEEDKEKSSTGSTDFSTSADVAQIEHWYCRFVATPPTLNYPLAPREEEDGGLLSTCTGTTNIRTSYRGQRQLSVPAPSSN